MKKVNKGSALIYFSASIFAMIISYFLTYRYFPIEPDAANSSLVWRGFLTEGFSVFRDWAPTPDNWYFTIYPFNFIFFSLYSDDGKIPLILSTSAFIALTSVIITIILNNTKKTYFSLISLACLILFPAYSYTFGFLAHPFSHNSTNFFGVVVFGLCFWNIEKKSIIITILYSFLAVLAAASDPWFLASYFLPVLLSTVYFSWKKYIDKKSMMVFGIAYVLAITHVIQRIFGLPIQRLKVVGFEQWIINAEWVVNVLGKSMNIFFIDLPIAYIASFIVWSITILYSLSICLKAGIKAQYIGVFSALSIAGIISSFIISYEDPAYISARFFMNAVCFGIAISVLTFSFKRKYLIAIVLAMFIGSSIYSYQQHTRPLYDQEEQTLNYIKFLEDNNLTFGYSDYWKMSNSVNWFSNGSIHITPVLFDNVTYRIRFNFTRLQTMRSWLTDEYIEKSPKRQFVAIPAVKSIDENSEPNLRLNAIKNQVGIPDQVLTFQNMTIYVYNHKIAIH
ncbi:hypothetical protein SJI19_18120 [Acerihabitans sp. TG2]|uniref:hypothetical protein n=1 Tax=Acerihabitans sp. TG2 TaxID=3096008 RepID=UPI002B233315|nr:hypothetical protein [Acerihabitans sp. TG2]MEA9392435.1 hypothetical protein [Acerihabitans sp. TG2]